MKKIVSVKITQPQPLSLGTLPNFMDPHAGKAVVTATYDDGSTGVCLSYYADELRFSESEFTGLTEAGVSELFHRKDVAYLRS